MLLVTPAPGWSHQEMSGALYLLLSTACPPSLRVLLAPFAVRTAPTSEVQPDVLVARYDDLIEACLPVAPLLVVETLSRSTQLNDRNTKKAHYERLGVPSYWLLHLQAGFSEGSDPLHRWQAGGARRTMYRRAAECGRLR